MLLFFENKGVMIKMENKKIFLIILSFLPILLYPISLPFSLIIAVGLVILSAIFVKDEVLSRQMLRPLTVYLLVAIAFMSLNFVFDTINGFGALFRFYFISPFKNFLDNALIFVNALLMLVLIAGVVLILLSYSKKKKVVIVDDLIDGILLGTCLFRKKASEKTTTEKNQTKKTQKKVDQPKEEKEEVEIEIEEPDEKE